MLNIKESGKGSGWIVLGFGMGMDGMGASYYRFWIRIKERTILERSASASAPN